MPHFQAERQDTRTTSEQSRLEVALREALQVQVALFKTSTSAGLCQATLQFRSPLGPLRLMKFPFKFSFGPLCGCPETLPVTLRQDLRCCCRTRSRCQSDIQRHTSAAQAAPIARIWLSWSASVMKHRWRFNASTRILVTL